MDATASSEMKGAAPPPPTAVLAPAKKRIVAIDVARGIALVAMTIYHFSWDLSFFGYLDPALVNARPWVLFARGIATSFLFLVGVSLVLAHGRGIRWRPFLVRLAQVVAGAAAVTVATYLMDARTFVFFGILHAIALFSVLALPFLRLPAFVTLATAVLVWTLGNFATFEAMQPGAFHWIGLAPVPPSSNDYVPLFPFFSAVLAGVGFARIALARGWFERMRAWRLRRRVEEPLDTIGRHSLVYYLLHQPVLFALLFAWTFVSGGPDLEARAERQWTKECIQVRDEAFCRPYVACVKEGARAAGLLDSLARNRIAESDRAAVDTLVTRCAAR